MTGLYPIAAGERLPAGMTPSTTKARATGERRPPKRGEWYLSGAIIEAHRAPNDYTMPFMIARLVAGRIVYDA
jgi:hypothetical protein